MADAAPAPSQDTPPPQQGAANYFDKYGPAPEVETEETAAAPPKAPQGPPAAANYFDKYDPAPAPAPAPKGPPPPSADAEAFRARVGRYPENKVELENFKATPQNFAHPATRPNTPGEQAIADVISDPARTGLDKATQIGAILSSSVQSRENVAKVIATAQADMPPEPEFIKQADEQMKANPGLLGALGAYIQNPRALIARTIQGLVTSGGVLAASSATGAMAGSTGGPLGASVGAAAGAGGAGYLQAYGETVLSTLSQHGVNLADQADVLKALNDPALMHQANDAAAQAGIPAAVINAASFGLAGRIFGPVAKTVGRPILGRVAGVGAEAATQATIGGGGEAATQELTQGRIVEPGAVVRAAVDQALITALPAAAHVAKVGEIRLEMQAARDRSVIERAQEIAGEAARAAGGDNLEQVGAAVQVTAELSAVHEAVRTQGARELEETHQLTALASHKQAEAEQQALPFGPEQQALPGMEPGRVAPVPGQGELPLGEPTQPGQGELPLEQQTVQERMRANAGGIELAPASHNPEMGGAYPAGHEANPVMVRRAPTEPQAPGEEAPAPAMAPEEKAAPAAPGEAAAAPAEAEKPVVARMVQNQAPTAIPEGAPAPESKPGSLTEQYADLQRQAEALHNAPHDLSDPAFQAKAADLHRQMIDISEQIQKQALATKEEAPEGRPATFADRRLANNASGESAASQEAVNRVEQEKGAGIQRFSVDPDGNRTPLTGVDAADARAQKGGLVIQRDADGNETILDRGGLNQMQANGLLNRSKSKLNFVDRGKTADQEAAEDLGPKLRMEKDEAAAHAQPLLDRLPPAVAGKVNIHDSVRADSVPKHIRDEAAARGHMDARGVYDPKTDQIHIFADGHDTGDVDELHDTILHESMHHGLRNTLGDAWKTTMDGVSKAAPSAGKQWMKDYADQHSLDMSKARHRAVVADEYAVHLARGDINLDPTAWQKIKDTVRQWAAKMGFGRYMSDEDIRDLVARSNSGLAAVDPKLGKMEEDSPLRFADRDEDRVERIAAAFPDDHPNAIGARLQMTKEAQTQYAPSYADHVKDAAANLGYKGIPKLLGAIDMRHLPDYASPEQPSAQKFIDTNDSRRGRQGRLQQAADARLLEWSRAADKDPDANALFGTIVHASTIAGVDPSKPFASRWSTEDMAADPAKAKANAKLEAFHGRLQNLFDQLGQRPDGGSWQQRYSDIRDDYAAHRDATWKALEARVNETSASDETKKNSLASLRRMFEASRVAGPYFPLFRTGDYWARAIDADGNHVAFTRFENAKGEREQWLKNMQDLGFKTETGKKDTTDRSLMERIDPDFVRQIMEIAKDDPGMQDDIWQTYLRAMPEMSMRKNFIHRQGRLGFSADAMRAYSFNMTHGAMQISRLEYGNRLDTIANQIKAEADALQQSHPGTYKAEMASALASEFAQRNQWIKNPQTSPWTNTVNQAGFLWYLGAAPATAYRIHTQNSMLASPIMAAHFAGEGALGFARSQTMATTELNRAVGQWAKLGGDLANRLEGDEKLAFQEAADQGMFTNTWAATLGKSSTGGRVTGPYASAINAAQWLFNAIEHKNRMTTFLASYRMGRMNGMDHDAAFRAANKITWDAHLDYGSDNRARYLQGNVAKVAAQFKQYPIGVAYRLARDFRNSLPEITGLANENITPQQRSMAQKQFAGILVRSFMYAGAVGLPMMWAVEAGINKAFSTKDTPFDAREAAHSHLQKEMGRTAADAIMYGPMSAVTGASLSPGASYSNLLYKTPEAWHEMTTGEKLMDATTQLLGPSYGAMTNASSGVDMAAKSGNWERGAEHMVPPSIAGPMKAYRIATQGATNLRGQQIMTPDELGDGWSKHLGIPAAAIRDKNLFLQAMNFTPQVLSDRYQQNTVLKQMQRQIEDRRSELSQRYDDAAQTHDSESMQKVMDEMKKFNQAHPGLAINPVGSVLNRLKGNATAVHGVAIDPKLRRELMNQYGGGEQ